MGKGSGWLGLVFRVVLALVVLTVTVVLAVFALPLGVLLGWRVASGGWVLPVWGGEPVAMWRVAAGIVAGGLVFRLGLLVRRELVRAWRAERDAAL